MNRINDSVTHIADGRKGLATAGETEAGLVTYHVGLSGAMAVFQEAAASQDAATVILVEHAFLTEEKRFCDPSDKMAIGSLTTASDSFDDALLALKAVLSPSLYAGVDMAFPHNGKYRVAKMPKDAFHLACIAHKTRLSNILKTPASSPR